MTYPQDPYSPEGGQPQQPDPHQPSGYDQQGYPQYGQPYGTPQGGPTPPGSSPEAGAYGAPQGGPAPGSPADPGGYPPSVPPPLSPYPQQPYGYAPAPRTNVLAILALVFAFVFSPVAIVLGHMAKKQIRETGEQGEGLATAGLILGYVFTGLYVVFCCIYGIIIVFTGISGSSSYHG